MYRLVVYIYNLYIIGIYIIYDYMIPVMQFADFTLSEVGPLHIHVMKNA